jgi:hypothetical protein
MVQLKLDLSKVSVAEFAAIMADDEVFLDTVYHSLEEARAASPGNAYREVTLEEDCR